MLLRSVTRHVSDLNWAAVALDFVIVVVGVFFAIQVDAWNNQRIDRKNEQGFLLRLHEDVELAERLSERVRASRLERSQLLVSASGALIGRLGRDHLESEECMAISASHHMGIVMVELTAFNELVASGQLNIIENADLRGQLSSYSQLVAAAQRYQGSQRNNLTRLFPQLVEIDVVPPQGRTGVRYSSRCDFEAMRNDRAFMNALTENTDIYDAFLSDALQPWSDSLGRIHDIVDAELGIDHGDGA